MPFSCSILVFLKLCFCDTLSFRRYEIRRFVTLPTVHGLFCRCLNIEKNDIWSFWGVFQGCWILTISNQFRARACLIFPNWNAKRYWIRNLTTDFPTRATTTTGGSVKRAASCFVTASDVNWRQYQIAVVANPFPLESRSRTFSRGSTCCWIQLWKSVLHSF